MNLIRTAVWDRLTPFQRRALLAGYDHGQKAALHGDGVEMDEETEDYSVDASEAFEYGFERGLESDPQPEADFEDDGDPDETNPDDMPEWWKRRHGSMRIPTLEELSLFSRAAHPDVPEDEWNEREPSMGETLARKPAEAGEVTITESMAVMRVRALRAAAQGPRKPRRVYTGRDTKITPQTAKEMGQRGGRIGGRARTVAKRLAALDRERRKRERRA